MHANYKINIYFSMRIESSKMQFHLMIYTRRFPLNFSYILTGNSTQASHKSGLMSYERPFSFGDKGLIEVTRCCSPTLEDLNHQI